ncbi:uncharacterized protein LOC135211686 [Macrobrachium nipponense]|uniref:uncharacterized protein LOC135211686 n=1 Tax=Macrobrachium nipponense TaxID=159736 RepID=UPI0030C8C39E
MRSDVTGRQVLVRRRKMMKVWLFPVVIWTLNVEPSGGQTGCQDINFFCGNWGDSGLCTSQRQFMQEQCPKTCGSCSIPQVLFPSSFTSSIANPDFGHSLCCRNDQTNCKTTYRETNAASSNT